MRKFDSIFEIIMRISFIIILCLYAVSVKSQLHFPLTSVHGSTKEPLEIHVKDELGDRSFLKAHMPKGKIYLVSIWATWCGSCRSELRAIQKVHCDWSEDSNFEFIAISIDTPNDHPKIFKMANKTDWNFKIIHDEYGYLVKELDVSKLPRMFLVDQNGNIVYEPKGYGARELKKIGALISAL